MLWGRQAIQYCRGIQGKNQGKKEKVLRHTVECSGGNILGVLFAMLRRLDATLKTNENPDCPKSGKYQRCDIED